MPQNSPLPVHASRQGRRGTNRRPGANLHKLPIGLDLAGISVLEGVRAALASAVFLALNQWIGSQALLIAAVGAMITCFCDIGGSLRQRLPMLLTFTALGAATWAIFGLLRAGGLGVVLPCAGLAAFLFSMARAWGLRAQTIGNVLIVVLALAIDAPLTPDKALSFFLYFGVGGLWACLLTVLLWRIQPDRPAIQAVAAVWSAQAALAADLRDMLLRPGTSQADWDDHARGHRRAVRAHIEEARSIVSTSVRRRGLVSGRGTQALLLLEAADQLFGELIILSELLETATAPGVHAHAERMLRRLRPILLILGADHRPDIARLRQSLDRMAEEAPGSEQLNSLIGAIVDRLRITLRVVEGLEKPAPTAHPAPPDGGVWRTRIWGPLRDELTWRSAILRHAVRATVIVVPAIAITLHWWTPYSHWLTITLALTMQPFFAATWQRALERVGGTVLGAAIGGVLAFFPQTPIVVGGLLFPLAVIGFSVRQVSYGAYIACLTPLIVLLFDIVEPGHSAFVVAGMRIFYTLVGGIVAVAACMLLWPSWEPFRLRRELRETFLAYARLAVAVLGNPGTSRAEGTEAARRAAGLANSNLEASLSRALQEPGRGKRAGLDKIIAADAILRRLGAALLATPHDPSIQPILSGPGRAEWQTWLDEAFAALADGRSPSRPAPDAPASSTLQRVRRGIDVLSSDLATRGDEAPQAPL
ncbi:FUSC family protein [Lichenihabitans sp. PAMC28606]|uniref:FUSC family protein n=1 Tax=Lichenihabitans sp. PAMC28606 TaxID=2880932 RepID=UPI001D0B55B2|nr:FUSC family protein [Lichenihabitans sp. PAMC28606]UDL95008.1 FUSC family protein [Lichenihabitans sp. PAMC28606]